MGYSKFHLFFTIVQGLALVYEVANQGPKKYGQALVAANDLLDRCYQDIPGLNESADVMATGLLEHIYNNAPAPQWMDDLKSMAAPLVRE